jgi:hypothetical protein
VISASAEMAIAELNEIIRPDGAVLRVAEGSSSLLLIDLDLSNATCPECVVPKDLLLDILTTNLATADPDIGRIELHDPREEPGRVPESHP